MEYTVNIVRLGDKHSMTSSTTYPSRGKAAKIVKAYPKSFIYRDSGRRTYTVYVSK